MTKTLILDDWQEDVLKCKGNLLLCTGRQVGKTTIFARKAAERMLQQPNCKIIIVSLTEDQAKLIIVMILDYLEKNARKEVCKGKDKPTQNRITLRNGSTALARPVGNTGDAVRGFTGDVLIIDEASRMPDLVWSSSKPTLLTTAGEIWMCSTPFGKQGYFWEAYQNKNNRYTVFHISSEEVINKRVISEGWTEKQRAESIKFLEEEKQEMSELRYGQEYLGLFLDELRQYFSDALIRSSQVVKRPNEIRIGRRHCMGVDLARMGGDQSTFEIFEVTDANELIQVENIVTRKTLTTQSQDLIIQLAKKYNLEKVYIDAGSGSLGVGVFDNLIKDDFMKRRVVAINNRTIATEKDGTKQQRMLKEDLYDNLRLLMEQGRIKLLDDPEIAASLKSVQYDYGEKEDQLSKIKIFGNDTHITEGLTRAAWILKEKHSNIWIKSIRI